MYYRASISADNSKQTNSYRKGSRIKK